MENPWSGEIPQVTEGATSAASIVTTSSYSASVSEAQESHSAHCASQSRSASTVGTALEVVASLLVRVDVAAARAPLDRHVADGHPLLHGKAVEDAAAVFVGVAFAAAGPEQSDDMKDDVLGVDSGWQLAVDIDPPDFELLIAIVWVARRSRTWLVPMPNAIAPNAPWVAVWESPQAMVVPGWVIPCSGPTT